MGINRVGLKKRVYNIGKEAVEIQRCRAFMHKLYGNTSAKQVSDFKKKSLPEDRRLLWENKNI